MIDIAGGMGANLLIGIETALSPTNLLYCFLGVFLGTLVGVLPGIGALAAISMLFPLTFYLEPTTALIMLAGIWYGSSYGGSTAAILLNLPGTPSSAITCLDGYPMAKSGRAGVALMLTTLASFFGGSVAIAMMMLFSPLIAHYALQFGSPEYFALMLLGLVAASSISVGSPVKSMAAIVIGILLGTIGIDIYSGGNRFTFGILPLSDGLSLVALAMGLFGVAEVISSVRTLANDHQPRTRITLRSMIPTRDDLKRSFMPASRGSLVGVIFGALPGTGPTIASFMAYALEKRVSREPERFGKGAIEGVVAPEAANNAADQAAFIPTMTLGIPGSATMAIMLGALLIQGITPGPALITQRPDIFWGLVMSFWIGNLLLVIINVPLIGIWVRLLTIPYHLLFPAVLMFVCIGVFSVNLNVFDIWVVLVFGAVGYAMRIVGLPTAPLILGFVLGPMMEEHFRRAMILSRGDFSTFFTGPINGFLMSVTCLLLLWSIYSELNVSRRRKFGRH